MGVIDRFLGASTAVTAVTNAASGVAGMFTPNATRRMELDEEAYAHAVTQHQAEFAVSSSSWFDALMNGMNRLPRPLLTLGTIGLFIYAMVEPIGFSERMEGLSLVPEPLWWLMGAIVSFYFGAREAHYFRHRVWPGTTVRTRAVGATDDGWRAPVIPGEADDDGWTAPIIPTGPAQSGAMMTEVEHRIDGFDTGEPVQRAQLKENFSDNPALRDWAASLRQ